MINWKIKKIHKKKCFDEKREVEDLFARKEIVIVGNKNQEKKLIIESMFQRFEKIFYQGTHDSEYENLMEKLVRKKKKC
jgi:hypothetical protein